MLTRARSGFRSWRRDGVPPAGAALLLVTVVATAVGLASLAGWATSRNDVNAVSVGSQSPSGAAHEYTHAPTREVRQVHAALHDFATWCVPSASGAAQRRLEASARLIVAFTRRHPNARFRVDDEWGTALSLLLVTRHELAQCSPSAALLADGELPADVRRGLPPLDVPSSR